MELTQEESTRLSSMVNNRIIELNILKEMRGFSEDYESAIISELNCLNELYKKICEAMK